MADKVKEMTWFARLEVIYSLYLESERKNLRNIMKDLSMKKIGKNLS
jgi:hypothetical protein